MSVKSVAETSLLLVCVFPFLLSAAVVVAEHACDSEVYCYGPLLETVQGADLYNDSKTFVDKPMRFDPADVLNAFSLSNLTANSTKGEVRAFVERYFLETGSELLQWTPSDWTESPQFVQGIKDPDLRAWALELNKIWMDLGRSISPAVFQNPQRYSLVHVPNPFIIPGGRFFEFYYWDTYWIVSGVLLCDMKETARGMIENLANLVERYGLVPNGGRLYYLLRSQPPLLTQMVDLYYASTRNLTFLEEMLPLLDAEYQFWAENRTLKDGPYANLTMYRSLLTDPRPEAFREDVNTSRNASVKSEVYTNLASAAESGMDFSSRWLQDGRHLSSIRTVDILPVDLNAILCSNEATLARLYTIAGSMSKSAEYESAFKSRQAKINAVFWNESLGYWSDVVMSSGQHNPAFYLSHLAPLAWRCVEENTTQELAVLNAMQTLGLFDFVGGIPTSCNPSGQQWDFPNSWAPHQWYVVTSWFNSTNADLRNAALSVAEKWINTTYTVWKDFNHSMFEKYNAETGYPGGGGEYEVQTGFGWTNGVVLHFLRLYGSVLRVSVEAPVEETRPFWVIGLVLAIVALSLCFLLGGMWCRWIYITGRTGYWRRVQNEHAVATRGYHESDDFDVEDDSVMLGNVTALSGSTQGILSTVHETEPSL